MRNTQLNFLQDLKVNTKKTHGGITKGKRKVARPISTTKWSHLVLKSNKAKGFLSFLRPQNRVAVNRILKRQAARHGVEITDFVNMGNHLHVKVLPKTREGFQKFLKSVTAMIARAITGAKKGFKFGKFWDGLAFTRVIQSNFELLQLKGYFNANRKESHKGYQARAQFLAEFNGWLRSLKLQT